MNVSIIAAVYWGAALVILLEALNKIERTELFAVDPILRQRLEALRNAPSALERLTNRARCLWWRLVSLRDRARAMLHRGGWRRRVIDVLKLAAWTLLALGAAGALASPFYPVPGNGADVCTVAGFALLIVRSRIKEVLLT